MAPSPRGSWAWTAVPVLLALQAPARARGQAYREVYEPGLDGRLGHQVGAACGPGNQWWCATVQNAENEYMTYGPYATDFPAGQPLAVDFSLAIDNNVADDQTVVELDVNDAATQTVLTSLTVRRQDFSGAFAAQTFTLFVSAVPAGAKLEYRVFYVCCSEIQHQLTTARSLDPGPMGAFWSRAAHFEFVSSAVFPTTPSNPSSAGMNVGFYIAPSPGGLWYLFHREYFFAPQPSYCTADFARIVVRTSVDRGLSWSNETVIASPSEGTAYECALVDGAAFFDGNATALLGTVPGATWLYLSQCLDRNDVWNMCLFTRSASNPTGSFTPYPNNPVVRGGQLWGPICGRAGSHCPSGMSEEGTPEIVAKSADGYYYVTFHGWDPAATKSARGVARTVDFVHWETFGAGLPGDALFTSLDCAPSLWPGIAWKPGGCVGGGEGTMLRSGDFLYHLIEAPDVTLGCLTTTNTQNWDLGLLRAPALLPTTQWEQFAVQPTIVSEIVAGCYIQYHRLFYDPYSAQPGVYLEFWAGFGSQGNMHIFYLTPGAGPLPFVAHAAPGEQ